jgi:hypothetical protein
MGSSSTTQVQKTEIPKWYEDAAKLQIRRADEAYTLGKMPYMGPEVAVINPAEMAASRNVGQMASAFGLEAPAELSMGDMPTVTQGGMTGYTSYPAYIANMERLREQRPDQYDFFSRMTGFDPITGASVQQMSTLPSQTPAPAPAPAPIINQNTGGEDNVDALALHRSLFPQPSSRLDTKGQIGKYEKPSGGGLFSGIKSFFGG